MRLRCSRDPVLAVVVGVGIWVALASPAWAQSSEDGRRWEVEGFGGFTLSTGVGEGSTSLPPPGSPIATTSPIFPSRRVSSWFFGDGAALLNLVNEQFGVPDRIEPLDGVLDGSALVLGGGLAGGVRVRRVIGSRTSIEVGLELFPSAAELSDGLLTAADRTRDSFGPAFQGLLATGPFTDVAVEASSEASGSSMELAVTGAFVYHFGTPGAGGFVPYLTLGGGVTTGVGDGAAVTLTGRYRFDILGEVPIDETDRVTISHGSRTAPVGVVGAGLRRDVSSRWGVRFDGRVLVGPQTTSLLFDADPMITQGTPAGFVESFTNPSIQFSNDPATGRESTLGGPPLEGFEAFESDGIRARLRITGGLFVRF